MDGEGLIRKCDQGSRANTDDRMEHTFVSDSMRPEQKRSLTRASRCNKQYIELTNDAIFTVRTHENKKQLRLNA